MSEEIIITKVNYFIDYWRDFLYSESIEEDLTHTVICNPRELFQEFADEILRKQFNNKDNKDFFIKSTNKIYNFNIESTEFLKSTLLLIKHQFNKKPNFAYLLHLLSVVDRRLSTNELIFNCINELKKILMDDCELNSYQKEKIKTLTKIIIFEFINREYSTKSIEKFVYNIFDKYQVNSNGIICTEFPHNCQVSFITNINSIEFQEYQERIKQIIDNLNLSKRILSLKNYLKKEPEELTYIFQIRGLKGDINTVFGDVRIYNPQTTKLIQDNPAIKNFFDEFFNSENFVYCNGAVTLKVVDSEYAKKYAVLRLNEVLNILLSGYSRYKLPIRINTNKMLICDNNGNRRGIASNVDSDVLHHHKSLEIDKSPNTQYLADYYNLITVNKLDIDYIILESLHWKRKAIESFDTNEQILWYWISIENVFNDTSLIFDILPKLLAINKLYDFTWKHYRKLQDIEEFKSFSYFRQDLDLPEVLCQKIGFRKQVGENIQISEFIDNITDVQKEIPENCLLHDQLSFLSQIFNNSKTCIKLLEEFETMAREKLFFVYRIRNKIVHNASNKSTATSNYYLDFIAKASSNIVFEFIRMRSKQKLNLNCIDDILNEIIYNFDKLKIEIQQNGSETLLNR